MKKLSELNDIKEFAADMILTIPQVLSEYDLEDTELFFDKGDHWPKVLEKYDEYYFYCGPKTTDDSLSDTVYINEYLEIICKELGISDDVEIGSAENMHTLLTAKTAEEADILYNKLRERLLKDFTLYEDFNL